MLLKFYEEILIPKLYRKKTNFSRFVPWHEHPQKIQENISKNDSYTGTKFPFLG
jgi:hypothetical protein